MDFKKIDATKGTLTNEIIVFKDGLLDERKRIEERIKDMEERIKDMEERIKEIDDMIAALK